MIGVLALQGDFAEHLDRLKANGCKAKIVRSVEDLSSCAGIIIPGGESTSIGKLLQLTKLDEAIKHRFNEGSLKIWGTCAGAILCSKKVITQKPVLNLGLGDYSIERNAYGNQLESFEESIFFENRNDKIKVQVAFIRAPKIVDWSADFHVCATFDNDAIFLQCKNLLVSTCHPELYSNLEFYKMVQKFLD